jgi:KaiC/GvpD/RAD55 family RecA-like ATPase
MAAEGVGARVSTGIEPLDRELGGGVFPGSVVALTAPPASQSEPLLHASMRERPTLYLTTRRAAAVVEADLDRALSGDDYDVVALGGEDRLAEAREAIEGIGEGHNVVVDTVEPLISGADTDRYVDFLNDLKERLLATDSVALLHCVGSTDRPAAHDITLGIADVVWDLTVRVNGTDLENRLSVPKFRGGDILDETIKLELGETVRVDTSRDIA